MRGCQVSSISDADCVVAGDQDVVRRAIRRTWLQPNGGAEDVLALFDKVVKSPAHFKSLAVLDLSRILSDPSQPLPGAGPLLTPSRARLRSGTRGGMPLFGLGVCPIIVALSWGLRGCPSHWTR